MSVNLMQDNVKYQGKVVLCRDIHFDHTTAGNQATIPVDLLVETSAAETYPWD